MAETEIKKLGPLDFDDIFNAYMKSNQKTWGHDRKKTLGGSEAFGCLRKAWYTRNDTPKDEDYKDSWGAIERGNIIENNFVVPALEHAAKTLGFDYLLAGPGQQVTFFDKGDGYLSVTPDGLIVGVPRNALEKYGIKDLGCNSFLLEIKSIDPRVNLSEEKSIHHGQVQIQMGLVRDNTAFKPNYAVILYINASFLDDIEVFVVPFEDKKYQIAKDRAAQVYSTDDPSKLMREGRIDGSCQYCPFQTACIGDTIKGMPPAAKKPTNMPDKLREIMDPLMLEKRAAAHAEKKAIKHHELVKEQIKEALREHGVRNPKNAEAGWSISYTMQDGKKGLDTSAMEADGIDLSKYEKRGNPFEVLRVSFRDTASDEE